MISDNGDEFKAEFSDYCAQSNIGQRFVRPHSPQANGVCERTNGEVRKIKKALMVKTGEMDWKTLMPRVQVVDIVILLLIVIKVVEISALANNFPSIEQSDKI